MAGLLLFTVVSIDFSGVTYILCIYILSIAIVTTTTAIIMIICGITVSTGIFVIIFIVFVIIRMFLYHRVTSP